MRKIAIIGAGNVGIAAAKALLESPDMELCGFIRRKAEPVSGFEDIPVAKSVFELPEKPYGAIITIPSRFVEPIEKECLEKGIYTVDGESMESAPHPKQQLYVDFGVVLEQYDVIRRAEHDKISLE